MKPRLSVLYKSCDWSAMNFWKHRPHMQSLVQKLLCTVGLDMCSLLRRELSQVFQILHDFKLTWGCVSRSQYVRNIRCRLCFLDSCPVYSKYCMVATYTKKIMYTMFCATLVCIGGSGGFFQTHKDYWRRFKVTKSGIKKKKLNQ